MTYATLTDLQDAFGETEILQLTDRDGAGTPSAGFVAAVLARADALIDSYLLGRYALPLDPTPTVLVATACDLARYWLYDDAAPDRVRQSYEDAMSWLRDVAAGRVLLQLPAASPEQSAGSPDYGAPDRVFSPETLAAF